MNAKREPEGIPKGGQWATENKPESDVDLSSDFRTATQERADVERHVQEKAARFIADRLVQEYPGLTSFEYYEDENSDYEPRLLNAYAGETHVDDTELEGALFDDTVHEAFSDLPVERTDGPAWAVHDIDQDAWTVTIADLPSDEPDNSPPAAAKRVRDLMREKAALQRRIEKESAVMIAVTIKERFPEATSLSLEWDEDMGTYGPNAEVRSSDGAVLAEVDDETFDMDPETKYELQDVITNLPEVGSRWSSSAELRAADPERNWIAPGFTTGSANLDLTRF